MYIKLDKKLIVTIDTLQIDTKNKNNSSIKEIENLTNYLPYIYQLFDYVSIQNIKYSNKTIHFLYKDKIFYVDSNFITIDAKFNNKKEAIEIDIKNMILKDFALNLNGYLTVNLKNELYNFKGKYNTFNINGDINLNIKNNNLFYSLNTKKFNTLKPFMDFLSKKIDIEPLLSEWIYKRIIASEYKLHYLKGKFNLNTYDFYPKLMSAKATGKNTTIRFNDKAPLAVVKDMDIILEDNKLIFDVKKAEYQGKDLSRTKVHIYHLMTAGAGIIIDLKANITLDDSIHAALLAFNIKIPITQTSGKTESNVKIDINFLPIGIKSYTGYFKINDANISLSGLPIYSKSGYIELDNGIVRLNSVNLKYDTIFDIYTSGDLNLTSGVLKSINKINSLNINFDSLNLLHVEDLNTTASMTILNNGTSIYVDKFKTNLEFLSDTNKITIENLSSIYKYSPIMKLLNAKDGQLNLETEDFKKYNIFTKIKNADLPLMVNNKKIKNLDLVINVDGKDLDIVSTNYDIKVKKRKNIVANIKNIDIAIDSSSMSDSMEIKNLTIKGINSNIIDINSSIKIPSNKYILKINDKNITYDSQLFKQTIFLEQTKNSIYLDSKNLTDMFINSLLGKDIFENGAFKLYLDGDNSKKFDGTFIAQNTIIKGMEFYNNIMALMHTIPSLATFKNPGFNEKGYKIDYAYLDFTRAGDIITIDKLNIDGKSADIIGSGNINITTGAINITLQISVFKNLSSIVNEIPVVNYIILGKDGKMYTQIEIKGTISKPIIKTNILQDTALSPFGIIKRTLETPFRIFK